MIAYDRLGSSLLLLLLMGFQSRRSYLVHRHVLLPASDNKSQVG
jgi:hypothetical protein